MKFTDLLKKRKKKKRKSSLNVKAAVIILLLIVIAMVIINSISNKKIKETIDSAELARTQSYADVVDGDDEVEDTSRKRN